MSTTKQVWECPTCGSRYESPIAVYSVICPEEHLRKSREMKLVEGTEPNRKA